jgi:hypothetical protein
MGSRLTGWRDIADSLGDLVFYGIVQAGCGMRCGSPPMHDVVSWRVGKYRTKFHYRKIVLDSHALSG